MGSSIQLSGVAVYCAPKLGFAAKGAVRDSEIMWWRKWNYYSSINWNCGPLENFVFGFWKESICSTNIPLVQVCWASAAEMQSFMRISWGAFETHRFFIYWGCDRSPTLSFVRGVNVPLLPGPFVDTHFIFHLYWVSSCFPKLLNFLWTCGTSTYPRAFINIVQSHHKGSTQLRAQMKN